MFIGIQRPTFKEVVIIRTCPFSIGLSLRLLWFAFLQPALLAIPPWCFKCTPTCQSSPRCGWYEMIHIDAYWYIMQNQSKSSIYIIHNPRCWNNCSSKKHFEDVLWNLLSLSTAGASFHGRVRLLEELGRAPAHPCFNEMSTLPLGQNDLPISTLTWYPWCVLYDILSISRVFETFSPTIHLKWHLMTPQLHNVEYWGQHLH